MYYTKSCNTVIITHSILDCLLNSLLSVSDLFGNKSQSKLRVYNYITMPGGSYIIHSKQGAVSIRKTVLPGMAISMLKIRRPNGRLIFNMEIAIRR